MGWTGCWWWGQSQGGDGGPRGEAWLRIPLSHGIGFQEVASLQRLVIQVLVGNRALVGKVLQRSAKGGLPLPGLAIHHPVPLPTIVTC